MLRKFDLEKMQYHSPKEGEAECVIPVLSKERCRLTVDVRCLEDVTVSVVLGDGEFLPVATGKIIHWSEKVEGCSGVQIVANTGFWYHVQRSTGWFETVDPTPHVVALETTSTDVIRSMIDERLRAFKVSMELDRPLTEDEKDEFILDLVNGDLEFVDTPDEFGLGYEERLKEFTERVAAKQSEASSEEGAEPSNSIAEKPAEKAAGSSST